MSKTQYWVADVDGVKALVEGADQRDLWTRVRGWSETTAPAAGDRVWLVHGEHGGQQVFAATAAEQWSGLGWAYSPPPEPADFTRDPQLVDQAPRAAAEEKPKAQATGTNKEK
jgi:hypothetical protein